MKPLHGIRIADFTVHAAGPFCTHLLSQLGAECIKIETALRPDIFRKPHTVYGRAGPATFDQVASNKLSVRLNLKHPKGEEIAKRLVAISDVAAESFRAGVMSRLGLGYDVLSRIKPDLVMVSISSSGQFGPESHFAGYAPLFGAWGGLGYLSGYRDGPPVEMRHVMDHSVGLNAALATLAALHKRRSSGKGSHVDVAAREVASSLIGEALIAAAAGGQVGRLGNDDETRAPHGVYPSNDADRWVSISVANDAEWKALLQVMGRMHLAGDPRYRDQAARQAGRRSLDSLVSEWCAGQDAEEAADALQRAGVPAHVSWNTDDIVRDPHMRSRGAIVDVAEGSGAIRAAVSAPARFSVSDNPAITRGTPELGEHEDYVYRDLLGMERGEYEALVAEQVIY